MPPESFPKEWTSEKTFHENLYRQILCDYVTAELASVGAEPSDLIVTLSSKSSRCKTCEEQFGSVPITNKEIEYTTKAEADRIKRRNAQTARAAIRLVELAIVDQKRADVAFAKTRLQEPFRNRRAVATALMVVVPEMYEDLADVLLDSGSFATRVATQIQFKERQGIEVSKLLQQLRLEPYRGSNDLRIRWIDAARSFGVIDPLRVPRASRDGCDLLFKFTLVNVSKNWYSGPETKTPFKDMGVQAYFQVFALLDSAVEYAVGNRESRVRPATLHYPLPPDYPVRSARGKEAARVSDKWYFEFNDAITKFKKNCTLDEFDPLPPIEHAIADFTNNRAPGLMRGADPKSAAPLDVTSRIWAQLDQARASRPYGAAPPDTSLDVAETLAGAKDFARKFAESAVDPDRDVNDDDLHHELDKLLYNAAHNLGIAIINMVLERLEAGAFPEEDNDD